MAREGQQLWTVGTYTGPEPRITVTLELVTTGGEPAEVLSREPWRAVFLLVADAGRPAVGEVRLEPIGEVRPLAALLARELLKPAQALEIGRHALLEAIEGPDSASERKARAGVLASWHGLDPTQLGAERRGSRQPHYFYASIASLYLEAVASGSRSPVKDTAERLGKGYERSFVRDALTRARKRELLTYPGSPNKAGGCLTQLGREALEAGPPQQTEAR
jgi:hypothetical protein